MPEPLLKLLRYNQNSTSCYLIEWNDDCATVFNTLKQRPVSLPMMQASNFSYPLILELDACEYGIGCVLTQKYDKHKYVIAYASRTFNTVERNYSAVEREALAINQAKHAPYVLVNNLLYKVRHFNTYTDHRILGNKYLLVISKSLQQPLLQLAHDHPTVGHAGRLKTLHRLSSRVYWPLMRNDIFNYIQSCSTSQQYKYDNSPKANPMQLHTVLRPWHTIGIAIMGPFPPTFRQKRFLYGAPIYILSDNGPQFISTLFNEVCKDLGITRKFTANYHPQTNMTKRVNRNLKTLIAMYTQKSPGLWDKELQKSAFAIRMSINELIGNTPAYLNFGRDPLMTPLDLLLNKPTTNTSVITPEYKFLQQYRYELALTLRNTYELVREYSLVQKFSQKNKYNKHTSQRQFFVGDLVWIQIPTPQIDNTIGTITSK
ncbi:unnamed protein product [Adineta ricciae]|uniref:Integrase catalytic domain-containing protein n=1 Tax=Adineta ricciae TaxID=249248 RepID=A0A814TXE0_ADIRI|nr:unnamed protein product [Adineta ricciae]CAF1266328.1 unnamed protein product [Adineta ricciae]